MSFKLGIATHGKKTCNSSHDSSYSPSAKGVPSVIRFLNRLLEYLLSCESLLPPSTLPAPRRQPEKNHLTSKEISGFPSFLQKVEFNPSLFKHGLHLVTGFKELF